MFNPKINGSLEGLEFLKWVLARLNELMRFMVEVRAFMARMEKGNSAGARQTAIVNNIAREAKRTVEGSTGLPGGGNANDTLRKLDTNGDIDWRMNYSGPVLRYWISLEDGGGTWECRASTEESVAEATARYPQVEFWDDGRGGALTQSWTGVDRKAEFPIHVEYDVTPHSDGEQFEVSLPAAHGGSDAIAGQYVFSIVNQSATYTANVKILSDLWTPGYAGTNLSFSNVHNNESTAGIDFEPGEILEFAGTNHPVLGLAMIHLGQNIEGDISGPTDRKFWREVWALRNCAQFSQAGTLATGTATLRHYNATTEKYLLGKVTASVGTPSTGADIHIDVKRNGVSILTTPLVIAAGENVGTAVPDVGTHSVTAPVASIAGFDPDDYLTYEVVQVGSSTPGANLNVQVYYG